MIVIDCSILIAGILPDELDARAKSILQKLQNDTLQAVVPSLFYLEVSNVLLMAYRRKRVSKKIWKQYLDVIAALPMEVDATATQAHAMDALSELAEKYKLTSYDAAYLELAKRSGLPLATLDEDLHQAAIQENIAYE
ncbi:MAG: type II toxin-antitoxin system VapC family toxin [Candidatus Poribacteria bacterium]|nr:type II toxin-antitoxin system VapC family toxin [Candidatus Poribacteria bacterium]